MQNNRSMHSKLARLAATGAAVAAVTAGSLTGSANAAPQNSSLSAAAVAASVTQPVVGKSDAVQQALANARANGDRVAVVNSLDSASPQAATATTSCSTVRSAWLISRFHACANATGTFRVLDARSGRELGRMTYTVHGEVTSRTGSKAFGYGLRFTRNSVSGAAAAAVISGGASATNATTKGSLPSQSLGASGRAAGNFTFTSKVGSGKILASGATPRWSFTVPGATPSSSASFPAPVVRCDNALKGYPRSYGCVFPQAKNVLQYSLSGPVKEVAKHIKDAQTSGLPGAYGSRTVLQRLYDESKIRANRRKSCPESLPRPAGKSCDEYAFASTYQGGSLLGKYSRRMVNATQNTDAGRALNTFYTVNRILNKDPFQVAIVR
ncbi:NucA/NucB deoxyribonuclease domain-containing protein [Streptomyces sp. NPDC048718]|uniref:NucA/NucB deoxyribonuclease domain-containing protein n=1 Tax=Streptomyces sp. NPDC048718 TaxID=3365587 RepID=UPI00371780DA